MNDTMTISHQLTEVEFGCLCSEINDLSIKLNGKKLFRDRCDRNALVTYSLAKFGFQVIKLRHNKAYNYRSIEILLRPKLLIEAGNYYDVTHFNELVKVREVFNGVVSHLHLPDLLEWKVKRIDYTIDLDIDQHLIPIYMFLIKKANFPFYSVSNPVTQKYMGSVTNVYLSSKNVNVNIYDRYNTFLNKIREGYKECLDTEAVRNKLRFEIQYKNCGKELHKMWNTTLCRKSIDHFYDLIIGSGDYYLLEKSLETISTNFNKIQKIDGLHDFIKSVDQAGSVWKAKEFYLQSCSNREKALKKFSTSLNQVRKINVNPVSLKKEWGYIELPNLKGKINEQLSIMESSIPITDDNTHDRRHSKSLSNFLLQS